MSIKLTLNHRCLGLGKPSTVQRTVTFDPSVTTWADGAAITLGGIPVTVSVPESVELPWEVVATQV